MGSWNETCMLSGLPIVPGDKVVMLFLTKNPFTNFSGPGCYKNDFFFVRSIPLLGEYSDYGEMELAKGEKKKFNLVKRQFALDLISSDQTNREKLIGIPPVEIKNMTFKVLLDWLHEGHVVVDANYLHKESNVRHNKFAEEMRERILKEAENGPPVVTSDMDEPAKKLTEHLQKTWGTRIKEAQERQGIYATQELDPTEPVNVAKVFIRKDVWDSVCQMSVEGWKGDLNLQKFKDDAKQWVVETEKEVEERRKKGTPEEDPEFMRMLSMAKFERDNFFGSMYGPGSGSCGSDPPFAMSNKEVVKMLTNDFEAGKASKKDFEEVCLRLAELAFIEAVMSNTRQTWHLTTGTGSQSDNWDKSTELHIRLAQCGSSAGVMNLLKWYEDTNLDTLTSKELEEMDSWDRKNFEKAKALKQIKEALDVLLKE